MSDLKPCPFCGSEAKFTGREWKRVSCTGCGATSSFRCYTKEGAAEKWNSRPVEDSLRAALRELVAAADWHSGGDYRVSDAIAKAKEVLSCATASQK